MRSSIVATAALAISAGFDRSGVLAQIMASIGIIASIIGTFFVSVKDKLSQAALLGALRRGNYISAIIIAVASFFLIRALLGMQHMGIYKAIIIGLLAGLVIGYSTEYFTSASYPPTKGVSSTAPTGSATVIRGLCRDGIYSRTSGYYRCSHPFKLLFEGQPM